MTTRTMAWMLVLGLLDSSAAFAEQPQTPAAARSPFFASGGVVADADGTWGNAATSIALTGSIGVKGRYADLRFTFDVPKAATVQCGSSCLEEHSSRSGSLLVGIHPGISDGASVAALVGFTWADHSWSQTRLNGAVRNDSDYTWQGFTFGLEVPILVTRQLFLVPETRIICFPGADYGRTAIMRLGVVLRRQF